MRARRAAFLVLSIASMLGAAARPAWSQAEASAPELKSRGNQKMVDSDFVGAIRDYEAALALAPNDLALYYNVGRAQGLLGHYPESLAALETFAARAPADLRARIAGFDGLLAETRQRVGYLSVTCAVPGARVQLDASVLGATPLEHRAVTAAKAMLRIEAEGYYPDVRPLNVGGAEEMTVECRLLPKSTSGTLAVHAVPAGARITVDGIFRGNDRVEVPLKAGAHTVDAQLADYETTTTTLVVTAGSSQSLDLTLRAKSVPITSRWWFWGGVGVLVAGGVVLGVAALTEKSPDQGSIPPRQLGTPLTRF
jgi:hypothetical protein